MPRKEEQLIASKTRFEVHPESTQQLKTFVRLVRQKLSRKLWCGHGFSPEAQKKAALSETGETTSTKSRSQKQTNGVATLARGGSTANGPSGSTSDSGSDSSDSDSESKIKLIVIVLLLLRPSAPSTVPQEHVPVLVAEWLCPGSTP